MLPGIDCEQFPTQVQLSREYLSFGSDEIEEETTARMVVIESLEEGKWSELTDFLDAELEYFSKCKEIMEELRASWPMG